MCVSDTTKSVQNDSSMFKVIKLKHWHSRYVYITVFRLCTDISISGASLGPHNTRSTRIEPTDTMLRVHSSSTLIKKVVYSPLCKREDTARNRMFRNRCANLEPMEEQMRPYFHNLLRNHSEFNTTMAILDINHRLVFYLKHDAWSRCLKQRNTDKSYRFVRTWHEKHYVSATSPTG
jgi:hypothetical protein